MKNLTDVKKALGIHGTDKLLCSFMLSAVTLVHTSKKLDGYKVSLGNEISGKELVDSIVVINSRDAWYKTQCDKKWILSSFEKFQYIHITHSKGSYSFIIPMGIPFYDIFLDFIGVKELSTEVTECIDKITIDSKYFINSIKKASQFVMAESDLQEDRQKYKNVLIENNASEGLSIVSTNCFILYKSKPINVGCDKSLSFAIPPKYLKELSSMKVSTDTITLYVLNEKQISIEGLVIDLFKGNQFDYKQVLPDYYLETIVERKKMIDSLKFVLPCANKTTSQILFSVNGSLKFTATDKDFGFHSETKLPYVSSNIELETSFNGANVLKILSTLSDDKIKISSNNQPKSPIVFSDDNNFSMIMPLMVINR